MISFRLTHEEHERFRNLCISRGLRNVSELVRNAVNRMLDESAESLQQELRLRVSSLESRVSDLADSVQQAKQKLAGELGNRQERACLIRSAGR